MSKEFDALMARRPKTSFDATLSAHAVEEFWEHGFTRIDRITTDEEVEWLRDVYDLLFSGKL